MDSDASRNQARGLLNLLSSDKMQTIDEKYDDEMLVQNAKHKMKVTDLSKNEFALRREDQFKQLINSDMMQE